MYLEIIVTFYPNSYSQFENPEAPDFEKIASASSFFSKLSLPSSIPLPTSFIKVFPLPLPLKINRFRIPGLNNKAFGSQYIRKQNDVGRYNRAGLHSAQLAAAEEP